MQSIDDEPGAIAVARCGLSAYSNVSHFAAAFRQQFGINGVTIKSPLDDRLIQLQPRYNETLKHRRKYDNAKSFSGFPLCACSSSRIILNWQPGCWVG